MPKITYIEHSGEDAAGEHVEANQVTGPSANGNQTSPHRMTNFVACVTGDHDRTADHPPLATAIGSAQVAIVRIVDGAVELRRHLAQFDHLVGTCVTPGHVKQPG